MGFLRNIYTAAAELAGLPVYFFLAKELLFGNGHNSLPARPLHPPFTPYLTPRAHPVSAAGRAGKPSICLVEGWLGPGGAERQLATLATQLHKRGHQVRVRVQWLGGKAGHYAPYLRSMGIDVAALNQTQRPYACVKLAEYGVSPSLLANIPKSQAGWAASLALDLLSSPVDVIHSYCDHPNIFGTWGGILSGTPVIRCSWRSGKPVGRFYFEDWMLEQYRLIAQHPRVSFEANAAFAACDYADWIGIPRETVQISPNGFMPEWMQPTAPDGRSRIRNELSIPDSAKVIIFLARLTPEKRPFDMLEVFRHVTARKTGIHCVIAGTDFLENEFSEKLSAFPPEQKRRIHMLGLRLDVPDLLAASDLLLSTSEIEGISNAILEAMAVGVPVVATAVGGNPELIEDGVNGRLLPLGDIEAMAEAVLSLLADEELRLAMMAAGKMRIKDFSTEALYDRTLQAYLKALADIAEHEEIPQASFHNLLAVAAHNLKNKPAAS